MNDIIDKISSYNIFNYLFPGTLFAVIGQNISSYTFVQDSLFIAVFVYYFFGLVISRIGSLLIEPLLKKIGFIEYADYRQYILASKTDIKIVALMEVNNMYRTLCSLIIILIGLFLYEALVPIIPWLKICAPYFVIVGLLFLFYFSFQKQTNYIVKRIESASDD